MSMVRSEMVMMEPRAMIYSTDSYRDEDRPGLLLRRMVRDDWDGCNFAPDGIDHFDNWRDREDRENHSFAIIYIANANNTEVLILGTVELKIVNTSIHIGTVSAEDGYHETNVIPVEPWSILFGLYPMTTSIVMPKYTSDDSPPALYGPGILGNDVIEYDDKVVVLRPHRNHIN